MFRVPVTALAATLAALAPPSLPRQSLPAGVAARAGAATLTLDDFDEYLAARFVTKEEAAEALRQIARCRAVEDEGAKRGLAAGADEVRAKRDALDRRLREAGEPGLDASLRARDLAARDFDALLRLTVLHEKIVRAEKGLAADAEVPPEELARWLEIRIAGVEIGRTRLPEGAVATIGGKPVSGRELGAEVRRLLTPERTKELLPEALGARLVENRAREQGVVPTPADFDAELDRRRALVREDPKFRGASFDELLLAAGSSIDDVRRDPRTRTSVLLDLLVSKAMPAARLDAEFGRERTRLAEEVGEGRRTGVILLRAADPPDAKTPRSFGEAEKILAALAGECADAAAFADRARRHSEDDATRVSGGDLGVIRRGDAGRDPALVAAAFAAKVGAVAGPVRLPEGAALVFVREILPPPGDTALRDRLRSELRQRLYREITTAAPLQTYLD